jgi:hypothetical protein
MSEKLTYHVQGSSPDPYIVEVTMSPFSISCTCQAAENSLPCKHRILILSGKDPGIVKGDKSKLESINKAAEAAGVFNLLKNYEDAKAAVRDITALSEKAFKKYRGARLEFLEKRVKTDRAVVKAQGEMEAAIEAIVPPSVQNDNALKALRGILTYNYGDE